MNRAEIVARDKSHVWHPYTGMGEYVSQTDPLVVARAEGSWIEDVDGRRYLDGNSSWWVAGLGHQHPRLIRALREQAECLSHVSLAGTTHAPAALLAEELCALAPAGLTRVFYTDNGSTAVEVAVKAVLQYWHQNGGRRKTRFLALDGAFHGDTIGASSLGGVEIFRRPFAGVLFDCFRAPFPEKDDYERTFEAMQTTLRKHADEIAAVVVEPIVQGAAGMRIYDPRLLRALRALCTDLDIFLVLDEVFTGYGRTGPMWACAHAGISPDVLCLGKTFSSLLPMGAALFSERIFQGFLGETSRALMYGHTFCGNPLGAAVAREVLAIFRDEDVLGQVRHKAPLLRAGFERIRELPGVERVRSIGMVGALDFASAGGYLGSRGWRVYEEALRRGAYVRPLGDTVYLTPPLTIAATELDALLGILYEAVAST